jgi:hypothetical protein
MLYLHVGRQDQDAGLGELVANHACRIQALGRVRGRHPDVHDDEVGLQRTDLRHQLRAVASSPQDLETRPLQQSGHALA